MWLTAWPPELDSLGSEPSSVTHELCDLSKGSHFSMTQFFDIENGINNTTQHIACCEERIYIIYIYIY